jgi:hypothetical protein
VLKAALDDAAGTASSAGLRSMVGDGRARREQRSVPGRGVATADLAFTLSVPPAPIWLRAGCAPAPVWRRADPVTLSVDLSAGGDLSAAGRPGGAISVAASIPTSPRRR